MLFFFKCSAIPPKNNEGAPITVPLFCALIDNVPFPFGLSNYAAKNLIAMNYLPGKHKT